MNMKSHLIVNTLTNSIRRHPERSEGSWRRERRFFAALRMTIVCKLAILFTIISASSHRAQADINKDSSIDQILDAMHDVGKNLKAMAADVQLSDQDISLGDDPKVRSGSMVLVRPSEDDTKIHITFTQKKIGKKIFNEKQEFIIDGAQVIERDWSSDPKKETTRVIAAEGTKLNIFKLGEGPFPLPIGQTKEEVQKQFDVKKIQPTPESPAGTIQVELTPKKETDLARKFSVITLSLSPNGMPSVIETTDTKQIEMKSASLSNVRLNDAVKPEEFKIEKIDDSWTKVFAKYNQ